jgi:myo-inositol-1(or 4)-monophosphatase
MNSWTGVAEQAAREAGKILLDMQGRIVAREKAPADLVTEADVAAQQRIAEILLEAFPDHGFIGEEDSLPPRRRKAAEYTWIVDPLDGTTNYVHGLDNFGVSIALRRESAMSAERGSIVAGVVFDPIRDECFTAREHEGAFCNGARLRVSIVNRLDQALVAASLPARVEPDSAEVRRFLAVLYRCQALRRMGSAALNLCYVAAGKLDAYWATSVKTWDVAAGALLVTEAGGTVSSLDGTPFDDRDPKLVACSTPALQLEMLACLKST